MTTPLEQMQHNNIMQMIEREKKLEEAFKEMHNLAAAYKRRIEEYEDAVRRAKTKPMSDEAYRILLHF